MRWATYFHEVFDLRFGDFEDEFIVHLHDHHGVIRLVTVIARQPGVHVDHGALDDVGGAALHRGVDGGAFGSTATRVIARADFRQVETTAEDGLDGQPCSAARWRVSSM